MLQTQLIFNKYIDILFDQLQVKEQQLFTKEDLKNIVIKDNNNSKNRQIFDHLVAKLGQAGVQEFQQRLLSLNKDYILNSIIEQLYRYRPMENEQTILSMLNRPEDYFQGKFFQLHDPNGKESTHSYYEIIQCKKYKENDKLFLQFLLENGTNIYLHYNNNQILGIYTQHKRKVKLMDLFEEINQKKQQLKGELEFFKTKEEFNEKKCKIELGNYTLIYEGKNQIPMYYNVKCQAEYCLNKLDTHISYKYYLLYKENGSIEKTSFYKNGRDKQELALYELRQIVCNFWEEKKILNSITPDNAVNNIQIKEMKLDENKVKLKQLEEISECKDEILKYFKDQNNKKHLELLLSNLVINNFEVSTEKVQSNVLTQNINRIQELNQLLGIQESQESIIRNVILEAIYTNLIEKSQTLQCLKVMELLKESFHHTKSINNMDLIIFLGGTGSGKSTSINYYLGHDLEEQEIYQRKFIRLINEKDLEPESYAKIGQSVAVSETTFIHGYKISGQDKLMLCDCPGFDDTRGEIYDMNTMLSIDQTIKNCNSIKAVVLTLSYDTFFVNRGRAVVELFENLQTLIPRLFDNSQIKSSIYMLITKAPNPNQIMENLRELIQNIYKTDNKSLKQMEEDKQDNFEKNNIMKRIKIWEFVLHLIQENKIIYYTIGNKLNIDDQIYFFNETQGIKKDQFCKAMESQGIQQTLSKYILMQIDTWQNHIFEKFFNEIPKNINEAQNWIKQKNNNIEQRNQDIVNNQQSIQNKQIEIEKTESQNQKLNQLIESNQQEAIINELKNCVISNDILVKLEEKYQSKKYNIKKQQKAFNNNKKQIKLHMKEIQDAEYKIKQLDKDNFQLSTGNTLKVLYEYNQWDEDQEMALQESDTVDEQKQEAFNQVKDFQLKEEVKKISVKAGDFTGQMVHLVYIEKEFYLVPKNAPMNFKDLYNQNFFSEGRKYKAIIEGEHWQFDLGIKAAPDRKKMVYSIITDWKKGQTIPWFRISHDVPNIDLNEATIINQQAEIDAKKAFISRKNADINELQSENDGIQEQINFKQEELSQIEKKIKQGKKEQGLKQIQDQIEENKTSIKQLNNQIELIKNQIKTCEQSNISDEEHIKQKENELLDLEKKTASLCNHNYMQDLNSSSFEGICNNYS